MTAKHFLHDPTQIVNSALLSLPYINPSLSCDLANKIIYVTSPKPSNTATAQAKKEETLVSLISGGGSGHEPSFTSFVGSGLLTASVAGTVFASPSAVQITKCILQHVPKERGVLAIVMNYTGDVLNFGMAVEKARARDVKVGLVVVGDDVGVGRKKGEKVGRRGIAGTCLVVKIAGAAAERGASLEEVRRIAQLTADNIVSIGSSLSHVHVPGRSITEGVEDELKEYEVEVGMGIHNEAGSERVTTELPGLVKTMLTHCLDPNDEDRNYLRICEADEVVLLVNNLGGVSVLELGAIAFEVVQQLDMDWKIHPVRILSGTYMTSLNGLGFSISLLKVADTNLGAGASMIDLLDAPAEALGWTAPISSETWSKRGQSSKQEEDIVDEEKLPSNLRIDYPCAKSILTKALQRVIAAEPDITNYDTIVGDGDCGIGLKRGAEAVLKMLERSKKTDDALVFLLNIIRVIEIAMDGTSGALYSIFLNTLSHALRQSSPPEPQPIQVNIWAKALEVSLESLGRYTPAQPGDRTLIDALSPFVKTLTREEDVEAAAKAAAQGSQSTRGMQASLGRTVYVGGEGWQGVPDPGAHGLSELLLGLSEGLGQ